MANELSINLSAGRDVGSGDSNSAPAPGAIAFFFVKTGGDICGAFRCNLCRGKYPGIDQYAAVYGK